MSHHKIPEHGHKQKGKKQYCREVDVHNRNEENRQIYNGGMKIDIKNNSSENRPCPKFTKPQCRGAFSLNGKREFLPDTSELKYIRMPHSPVSLDLNHGMEKVIRKSEHTELYGEKIDNLLHWLMKNKQSIQKNGESNR